jgi:hypothetical protein
MNGSTRRRLVALVLVPLVTLALASAAVAQPEPQTQVVDAPRPEIAEAYFTRQDKTTVTFFGYSGAEYEHADRMLAQAKSVLRRYDPQRTIVNIGATPEGIGAVYEVAKSMGFPTTGIVSSQARDGQYENSPHVDIVFYVHDDVWGGLLEGSNRLSPTSQAMVGCSDILVAIGGGQVSRDELVAARNQGKPILYFPAEKNHNRAIEKSRRKGLPIPTTFDGAVHEVFGQTDTSTLARSNTPGDAKCSPSPRRRHRRHAARRFTPRRGCPSRPREAARGSQSYLAL